MMEKAPAESIDHIQGFFIAVPMSNTLGLGFCDSANKGGASSWIHMSGCQMEEAVNVCHHTLEMRQLEPEFDVCWSSFHLTLEECQVHGVEGDATLIDFGDGFFSASGLVTPVGSYSHHY